jgi:hypothetical protein
MYSENIPYTRIDLHELFTVAQFQEKLSNPKLYELLTEHKVENVLLNLSQAWRVGTEDMNWLENTWLPKLSEAGVKKLSVVAANQIYELFINIFNAIEKAGNSQSVEVHFFQDYQFYYGWEAVNWF